MSALLLERPLFGSVSHPNRLPRLVTDCAVAQRYLKAAGSPLIGIIFPEQDTQHPGLVHRPCPTRAPFVAAYLVRNSISRSTI